MSRLPLRRYDELDDKGRALWDSLGVKPDKEGLIGPFNAWAQAPGVGRPVLDLGTYLLSATSVERRLVELAIITTGARWRAEFEWWAHATMARRSGIEDDIVDAIGDGREPTFEKDDERVVFALAAALATDGSADDRTFDEAHALLGDTGIVEIITVCGYYTLVSFTLNALRVPLPPGNETRWE